MKTDRPGLLSGRGGSPSKGSRKPVGMKAKGDKLSKTKGGMAKSTTQPSKKDCR